MSQSIRHSPIDTTPVMFLTEQVMREILTQGVIEEYRDQERGDIFIVDVAKLRIVIGKALAMARRNGINERTDKGDT